MRRDKVRSRDANARHGGLGLSRVGNDIFTREIRAHAVKALLRSRVYKGKALVPRGREYMPQQTSGRRQKSVINRPVPAVPAARRRP